MKLTVLLLVCLACVKPSVERAAGYSKFDKGLKETLRELLEELKTDELKDAETGKRDNADDDENNIDTSHIDSESDAEDDAESQRVELPEGEEEPTNINPNSKEEQKEDNLDKSHFNVGLGGGPKKESKSAYKRIFEESATLWPGGVIPYSIDEASFSGGTYLSTLKSQLADAIIQLNSDTCVKWVERTTEENYVLITSADGCWSYVGKIGGQQKISLEKDGCLTVHTVLHEMLHAMGTQHEQSRSDRMKMTSMLWKNIDTKNLNNFDMANTKNAEPYDYKSIMQYELQSFGKNGEDSMSIPDKSFEYLITNTKNALSLYDIGEINSGYKCTADCTNTCQNGGVVTKGSSGCSCKCPSGLKGSDCSQLDTSDGCGEFITLSSSGDKKTISMDSYTPGVVCTWVIKGPANTRIKATIDSIGLPYNEYNDCYHWLEFRDYLIGDRGKERCGTQGGASFTKAMVGDHGRMMIRFNTAKHSDQAAGTGFSVTVEAVESGCIGSPCKNGGKCQSNGASFTCTCTNGFSGTDCNTLAATATTTCDFQKDFQSCLFQLDKSKSAFDFRFMSTVDAKYPGNEDGFQYLVMNGNKNPGNKAYLVTSADLKEAARCLSFKYLYIDQYYDDGYDASMVFKYKNSAGTESTLFTIGTADVSYDSWQTKSLDVPAASGLQLIIEANEGWQTIALDNISLKPGACA